MPSAVAIALCLGQDRDTIKVDLRGKSACLGDFACSSGDAALGGIVHRVDASGFSCDPGVAYY